MIIVDIDGTLYEFDDGTWSGGDREMLQRLNDGVDYGLVGSQFTNRDRAMVEIILLDLGTGTILADDWVEPRWDPETVY